MTMRALFAGVSGLRNHQVRMDTIGNNIANVNTIGFKASRVTFEESFAQLLQGASRPAGRAGDATFGTNPIQIGLGMNIGSVDMRYTQGSLQNTGETTDLAIQGDSLFVVSDGTQQFYTRSGNFQLDADGRLVASTNGFVVQGRNAVDGQLQDEITDIKLPFGQKASARETGQVTLGGNLNAGAESGTAEIERETTIAIFDSQGKKHEMTVEFNKDPGDSDPNTWEYTVSLPSGDTINSGGSGTLVFDTEGRLDTSASTTPDLDFTPAGFPNSESQTVAMNFGEGALDGITQFESPSTAVIEEQDGFTMGDLRDISIDNTGTITGSFTNGINQTLGQIVLADFNNPRGLIRRGDNMFQVSANSGSPVLGFAGDGSQSKITSGALEMSNVDLSEQFTDMITTQRGFQANARTITTSDEMMQELVSIVR